MLTTILKKYVWVINLTLLAVLAYLLAINVNGMVQSKVTGNTAEASQNLFPTDNNKNKGTNKVTPISNYQIIEKRNIFGVSEEPESQDIVTTNPDALPESNLNLVLLGTIMNADKKSVAIIKNDDNSKVNGYKSGENIDIIDSEKVRLVDVKNCKAIIQRKTKGQETIKCKNLGDIASAGGNQGLLSKNSKVPTLDLNQKPAGRGSNQINKTSENSYEVDRELLEDLLSDPTKIVQQARVIPQEDGLRFFGIRSNSIFWKIGIKNGDTLHKINNVELNDIERALSVFEDLRSQNAFTINLTRAGQQYTYEYTVK